MRTDMVAFADFRWNGLLRLGPLQSSNVCGRMVAGELGWGSARAVEITVEVQPPQGVDQVQRRWDARDGERVLRPIAGAPVDLRANEEGAACRQRSRSRMET
jgi:hypothetical protein